MKKLNPSFKSLFLRFYQKIKPNRKKYLFVTVLLMIGASFVEFVSIGLVLPFLAVLINPDQIMSYDFVKHIFHYLELSNKADLQFLITVSFCVAIIISGFTRIMMSGMQAKISRDIGSDFYVEIYTRTIDQPYITHLSRHSSDIQAGLKKVDNIVSNFMFPMMSIVTSFLIIFSILALLSIINWILTIVLFVGFGSIYLLILNKTKKYLRFNSEIISNNNNKFFKNVQEVLGAIRDIKLGTNEYFYIKKFKEIVISLQKALAQNYLIGHIPRYLVESLAIILLAVIAYFFSKSENGLSNVIPILGTFALGAQRILPLCQEGYYSIASIRGEYSSLVDVLFLLEQSKRENIDHSLSSSMKFSETITGKNLSFKYHDEQDWIIKNLNFFIKKGSIVGIVGPSGVGKSTLLDLMLGLLDPNRGSIYIDKKKLNTEIDKRSWARKIANVPQDIFIADATIEENIAFSIEKEKINHTLLKRVCKHVQVDVFAKKLVNKYKTKLGENGASISGGQKQRIGIARALYKQPELLILDEATNALDSVTAKRVLKNLKMFYKDLTIIIVSHERDKLKKFSDGLIDLTK
tara:strand:- start:6523 stop:8256 length:1734 start_codon:yes stop_codon:yes gene_type:complete